jgi:hypothetical protein
VESEIKRQKTWKNAVREIKSIFHLITPFAPYVTEIKEKHNIHYVSNYTHTYAYLPLQNGRKIVHNARIFVGDNHDKKLLNCH